MQPEASPTEGSDDEALHEVWDRLLQRERDVAPDWAPTSDDIDEGEKEGVDKAD